MKRQITDMEKQPGVLEKLSYGIGDFANNGMFTFVSTYLMYYCTDHAGFGMTFVSIMLMSGSVANAVMSPVMGILIDRTKRKSGKCRPYIAAGMVPVSVLLVWLFSTEGGGGWQSIVMMLVYLGFNIAYAMENVPYTTLLSVMTGDQQERISLNLFKNIGSNAGGIFVTAAALPLVSFFAGRSGNGYHRTALIFSVLFFLGMLLCAVNTRERVRTVSSEENGRNIPLGRIIAENRPWQILCVVQFLTMTMMIIRFSGSVYFAKYDLGNPLISSFILTVNSVICLAMAMVLPVLERRMGLKKLVMTGDGLFCLAMAGTAMAGKNTIMVILFHCLSSIGFAMATGMVFVILSQTIDYAEWKTGVRPQGMLTSLLAFAQKIGIGLAGLLSAQVLKLGGYTAGTALGSSAEGAVRMLFWGLPMILSALTVIVMLFYPDISKEQKK